MTRSIGYIGMFASALLLLCIFTGLRDSRIRETDWRYQPWSLVEDPTPELVLDIEVPRLIPVTVTIYHPVKGQTDDTPNIVASGKRISIKNARAHRYLAVSRDLHERWGGPLSFGEIVRLDGAGHLSGYYIVEDTMNARFTNRVDILMSPGDPLAKFDQATLVLASTGTGGSDEIHGMEDSTRGTN